MTDPHKIDLHMHSAFSDGTDTPAELLARVQDVGLSLFSLTDHDTVEGCAAILPLLREGDPAFVCGVEFSCEDQEGKYHILGYGYDPQGASLQALVKECHTYRINKAARRLAFLEKEFGFTFPAKEQETLFALPNPGKPHIADMMVNYGYAPTAQAAFHSYLNRYKNEEKHIPPERAVEAISNAGGIPILAHPSYGSGNERIFGEEMDKRLLRLMRAGVRGLEAYYSGFTPALCAELLSLAEKYDLYVTAGSDYHGAHKAISLGETHLNADAVCPDGLRRFLQDVVKATPNH